MKRGGLAIALVVVLTGALRWFSTGSVSPSDSPGSAQIAVKKGDIKSKAVTAAKSYFTHGPYAEAIDSALHDYFSLEFDQTQLLQDSVLGRERGPKSLAPRESQAETKLQEIAKHWFVPKEERSHTRFVVAFLPDPAHTQLNLYFDRGIEAIEQAAQERGYNFDRASLPWDIEEHPESSKFEDREAEAAAKARREMFPGLLIFRRAANPHSPALDDKFDPHTLIVFVVGEAPTGGIRKDQFALALRIITGIQDPGDAPPNPNLLLLGPTFSGSLASLSRALELNQSAISPREVFIYSGIVRGTKPRCAFETALQQLPLTSYFIPFQDNESHLVRQFVDYAAAKGYDADDIAILSEDETAYGATPPGKSFGASQTASPKPNKQNANPPLVEAACAETDWKTSDMLNVSFPRGIAQFRSAYARQVGAPSSQKAVGEGHAVLPLDLEATGSGDDSIPPFAKVQFPLSQEAVMLGIIARLHQRHPRLIILRSSDPVDQLFLARYLRQNFPQGRIVVSSPDLLFAREDDGLLHGVLGLSSYPLVPDVEPFLSLPCPATRPAALRAFPSTNDLGTYNALIALLGQTQESAATPPCPQLAKDSRHQKDLPVGPYAAYGNFIDWKSDPQQIAPSRKLMPDDWITILGRDGYWTLDRLNNDSKSGFHEISAAPNYPPESPDPRTALAEDAIASRHTAKPWAFAYALVMLTFFVHTLLVWFGSIFLGSEAQARFGIVELPANLHEAEKNGHDKEWLSNNLSTLMRRSALIAIGTASLFVIAEVMVGVRFAATIFAEGRGITLWLSIPPLILALVVAAEIAFHRGCRYCGAALAAFCILVALFVNSKSVGPYAWISSLTAYRSMHLTSGVSPLLPIIFLFASSYCLAWFELQGLSLTDCRRPQLPASSDLPYGYYRVSQNDVKELNNLCIPLSLPWRVMKGILCLIPLLVLTVSGDYRPILTMEGIEYDRWYAILLFFSLTVFLGCLFRVRAIWNECRRFLAGLDNLPLRDAFRRLQDFSWSLLWSPSGSMMRDSYKLVSRELECYDRLKLALSDPIRSGRGSLARDSVERIQAAINDTDNAIDGTRGAYNNLRSAHESKSFLLLKAEKAEVTGRVVERFASLQQQLAKFAGVLMKEFLDGLWKDDLTPVASSAPREAASKKSVFQRIAEEYVSLIYANYLTSILLRMRCIVVEAIGIYLCLLLSISFYPFEPNPAMFTLAVLLIVVMAVVIGYVYAQMHKDAALSRLTSTAEGELGLDFWVQFIAAGAVPVLGLLAVQFPAVSRILSGLLQPALQSVK